MKKRILCLILALLLAVSLLPISAFADSSLKCTETYINPLYRDVVSESDIPTPKKQVNRLFSSADGSSADGYAEGLDAAAAVLRSGMENRETAITVKVVIDNSNPIGAIAELALEETGVATQGDYIRWTYGGWNASQEGYIKGELYYLTITYSVLYYTTAEQETALGARVNEVLDSFGFTAGSSDYEKVCAVYDYICANVSYDYDNLYDNTYLLKHTAYAAIMNGKAVCQGYAALMYRMLMQVGVGCRLIPNDSHGWNIVRIDGLYYNVDSTWDAGRLPENYNYFLLSDGSFSGHERAEEYKTAEFYAAYPMSPTDHPRPKIHKWDEGVITKQASCTESGGVTYTCADCGETKTETISPLGHDYKDGICTRCSAREIIPGDMTGDGLVNALDLVRLKKFIAGESVEIAGSADTTGDGRINALDLIRLQKYIAGLDVEING